MGFIDYHGTKEDRYFDVLEFARDQQYEEARRLEDEKVNKWLSEKLKDSKYIGLNANDLMKQIIVRYRKLEKLKTQLITEKTGDVHIDEQQLWADFSLALLTKRMETSGLDGDKYIIFYKTFAEKIFKLNKFTPADKHFAMLDTKPSYQRYHMDCFDLVQEKQFWRWIGYLGNNNSPLLSDFLNSFEQLSIFIGYYMFQSIRPNNTIWMQRLDIEHEIIEKLQKDYIKGRFREPNYQKLQNPLYEPIKTKQEVNTMKVDKQQEHQQDFDEILQPKRPQLDKNKFEELLREQKIQSYVEACVLLRQCQLPEEMDLLYRELLLRLPVLKESIDKYEDVYQPDMYQFYEYYIPEALQLTATYIEYLDVGIGEKIFKETENDVLDAVSKLILAVNEKVDEIYKFALIEIKAKAKALENIMSLDGYVDSKFKIQ